ncbi:MAG: hypothetical protein IJ678_08455, partial [Kiritimatiellae bacterium]|nr:hypothetical protein [Kiritimatiellia bacterium]
MHPPAFELGEVPGAARYRLEIAPDAAQAPTTADTALRDDDAGRRASPAAAGSGREREPSTRIGPRSWLADKPWRPVDPEIWDSLPPGYYELRAEALGPDGSALGSAGSRKFYRAAVF